jgi:hypothetical protein
VRKLIFSLFFVLTSLLAGCTNQKDAVNALQDVGFTNIQVTGYHWFACSKDDFYHTGFVAQNPQGREVNGTVCSGLLFKNATVRFS